MSSSKRPPAKGRGAAIQPINPHNCIHLEDDFEQVADDIPFLDGLSRPPTQYIPDDSQSIISQNSSPDVPFNYSINPYRGCTHGCPYCYARPTHEYFGLSAGLDFETHIYVKYRAAELFRDWLARPVWEPELIEFSGVTDCYQPAEQRFRITRACLEVASKCRQPVGIVTKNALIIRDLDLLANMAKHQVVQVAMSITTLDSKLARSMEPRTSTPEARLRTIGKLTAAGVPTGVMVAPIIPGLTDHEVPAILKAAKEAGAISAGCQVLRLPVSVQPVFIDWLERTQSDARDRIESRLRSVRGGDLSDAQFGRRMRGQGEIAVQISKTFEIFARRYHLDRPSSPLNTTDFRRPTPSSGQMWLFH